MTYKNISWHMAHGEDGSPYLFRAWIGRLRLHIFYRGDADRDPHDHPWGFWTFPLRTYVEEVTYKRPDGSVTMQPRLVPAFRWSYRPATYLHRVIGPWNGEWDIYNDHQPTAEMVKPGRIVTIVWREARSRHWVFLKTRDGQSCWEYFKDYITGGRNQACNDD